MNLDILSQDNQTSVCEAELCLSKTPWLDANGDVLNDAELKKISKSWSAELWERFLTETVEGSQSYQREQIMSPNAYRVILDKMTSSIWSDDTSETGDEAANLLRRLVRDHLTPRQQQIIRMIYWDGLSERAAAEVIHVSRSTVAVQKRRSLRKLKGLIKNRQPELLMSRRVSLETAPEMMSRDKQIRDALLEDMKGPAGRYGGG